jgi:hypothetical protein
MRQALVVPEVNISASGDDSTCHETGSCRSFNGLLRAFPGLSLYRVTVLDDELELEEVSLVSVWNLTVRARPLSGTTRTRVYVKRWTLFVGEVSGNIEFDGFEFVPAPNAPASTNISLISVAGSVIFRNCDFHDFQAPKLVPVPAARPSIISAQANARVTLIDCSFTNTTRLMVGADGATSIQLQRTNMTSLGGHDTQALQLRRSSSVLIEDCTICGFDLAMSPPVLFSR